MLVNLKDMMKQEGREGMGGREGGREGQMAGRKGREKGGGRKMEGSEEGLRQAYKSY